MTRYTIMADYYERMADMAHKEDFESSLVPTSLKMRLDDLALLTALSKKVGESRNSIVSAILHDSLQEEIQSMTKGDVKNIGVLADEETKQLYKKHFPDREVNKHYLLELAEVIDKSFEDSRIDSEAIVREELEEEKQELLKEHNNL